MKQRPGHAAASRSGLLVPRPDTGAPPGARLARCAGLALGAWLAVGAGLVLAQGVAAQQSRVTTSPAAQQPPILFRGRGEPDTDARIRELLRESGWEVWTRDTLLARTDTVEAPVLLLGATARLEGTLLQELVIIDGDVFLRPSGRILGRVRNIAGGWYPSALATVPSPLDNRPNAPYRVERTPDAIVIRGTTHQRSLELEPLLPTYDRVDGLSLGAEAELHVRPLERVAPSLLARGTYHSERGQFDPGLEARLRRGRTTLAAAVERLTLNNQEWIRSDLNNSINFLLLGKDVRDYYQSERGWVELRRTLERGPRTTEVRLRAQLEDATSLNADDPWSLFEPDTLRPNGFTDREHGETRARSADPGRISSAIAAGRIEWELPTIALELDALTEVAAEVLGGDFHFARYEITGEFAMLALRDHTLEFDFHFRGPLPPFDGQGGDSIPRQRWTFVGGSGTLHTFQLADFYGDRAALVETTYSIPLGRRFRTPVLGLPSLDLLHVAGMAWRSGEDRDLKQNLGVRLAWNVAYLRFVTNPEKPIGEAKFTAGLRFPSRPHPWEANRGFF